MSIQGIGQSFAVYQSPNMRGAQGTNRGFDLSDVDVSKIMEKEDANLDGVLTIDETHMSEDMFSNVDADSDSQLTTEELEDMLSHPPPMMGGGGGMSGMKGGMGKFDAASIMEKEDTDLDSSISAEESSLPDEVFSELDTNQDGMISLEELQAGMDAKKKEMGSMPGFSSSQTVTQNQVMDAYRQAMESFMTNFSGADYTSSNLTSFLGAIA